jgi:hypothetical protein
MGMFADMLRAPMQSPSWTAAKELSAAPASQSLASSPSFDSEINNIVDAAVKSVFDPSALGQAVGENEAETSESKHHHHHRHHRDEEQIEERKEDLSESEKNALTSILAKLTEHDKSGKLKAAIEEALAADNKPVAAAPELAVVPAVVTSAPLVENIITTAPVATKVDEIPTPDNHMSKPESLIKTPTMGASRPLAPVMTSHIEKAPSAMDYIPESVYSQQAVPFKESLPELIKHVPKRILIPRMEEPGPVIGGSSRPVHIQIPASDLALDMKSATRPSAPMQANLGVLSEITTQVDTQNKADVSVKASSVAAANDEALTQPEVVIF